MPNHGHSHHGARPYNPAARGSARQNGLPPLTDEPIPSPYTFVPLSEKVFFPDAAWASQVSMDVPFSDGISGTLRLKMTAKTPIYIRNGGSHPDEARERLQDEDYVDFFRAFPGGPYAIPGSSMKGMLRAVLEIASFGKIIGSQSAPRVANHRYAVRDLQNPELYGNRITKTVNGAYQPKVRAAWLSECQEADEEGWMVQFCDFARVEQVALEQHFNTRIGQAGPASGKYSHIHPHTQVQFDAGELKAHQHSRGNRLLYRAASNLGTGATSGIIVLTGQPSERTGAPGRKHMEFIFFDQEDRQVPVPDSVRRDFLFAHSMLGQNRKPNQEWAFWQSHFEAGRKVPVFVLTDESNPDVIKSMGLAMMFRLPYENNIHDAVRNTGKGVHLDAEQPDLAELIFGRVEDQQGLRGRSTIETLVAEGEPETCQEVRTVLNGPKPTYYPNYIKQRSDGRGAITRYRTFMDQGVEIRGWKRYILGKDGEHRRPDPIPRRRDGSENLDVATSFRPLPAGTAFRGTMHIHNLRPAEVGAILWALEWGGDTNLRHSLGMGKPYGFGSIAIEVECGTGDLRWCNPGKGEPIDLQSFREAYENIMQAFLPGWLQSEQIRALKTIADPRSEWPQEVRYPRLGQGRDGNEFVKFKRNRCMLVDPLSVRRRPEAARAAAKLASSPAGRMDSKPRSAAEQFFMDIDRLSLGEIPKRMKRDGIDPAQVPDELRKQIATKLRKKPGANTNWNFREVLRRWDV